MSEYIKKIGKKAKIAFKTKINNKVKNKVLKDYCKLIIKNKKKIIDENKKDIKVAEKKKLKENLIKRLSLNNVKIVYIIKSIKTNNLNIKSIEPVSSWVNSLPIENTENLVFDSAINLSNNITHKNKPKNFISDGIIRSITEKEVISNFGTSLLVTCSIYILTILN